MSDAPFRNNRGVSDEFSLSLALLVIVDTGGRMGFEGAVVHNLFEGSREVQRVWVKVSLLGFLKKVLDPHVHDVEESCRK